MNLVFEVRLLPAHHGDCILLEWGEAGDTRRILIDAGPAKAYRDIAACLDELNLSRRDFELFVVTHVDADHIDGAVKLLAEKEPRLRFREMWFNGWPQLDCDLAEAGTAAIPAVGAQRGAKEGEYVDFLISSKGHSWNRCFGGAPILVADTGPLPRIVMEKGLVLTLLAPNARKLEKLRATWEKTVKAMQTEPGNAAYFSRRLAADARLRDAASQDMPANFTSAAQLAPRLDDSAANGSSIAFVAEFAGRRCALLGDAHAPMIAESFSRMARELGEARLRLDAVKLSHHGSAANLTSQLLARIDCRTFLISTDSGLPHPHPDSAAIERIVAEVASPQLLFNYRSRHTEQWDDENRKRTERYVARYPDDPARGLPVDLLTVNSP